MHDHHNPFVNEENPFIEEKNPFVEMLLEAQSLR
jgi:hypothetical protein